MIFENIVCPCLIPRYSGSVCVEQSQDLDTYIKQQQKSTDAYKAFWYVMLIGAPDTSALDVFNIMYISDHQQVLMLLDILQGVRTNTY